MPTAPPTFRPPRPNAPTFGYNQTTRHDHAPLVQGQEIRNTKRWQRLRRLVLSRNPVCADPYGQHVGIGQVVLATQVDHILALQERPDLAFTERNLQGLCTRCHARKTQEERREGPSTY